MAKKKKKRPKKKTNRARPSPAARLAALSMDSDESLRGKLPESILNAFEVREWKHAAAILATDFPNELDDIVSVLDTFFFTRAEVQEGGGGKSPMSQRLEVGFEQRGWASKSWNTSIVIDGVTAESPTHEVDCHKNRVALEIEWSNKDPFFDRDLNNFRLLFDLRAISVGIVITKSDELEMLFKELDIWDKYGRSTTWMSKLVPRVQGGGGGGCPLLVFGIRRGQYRES